MEKKKVAKPEHAHDPFLLAYGSPRDYSWETFSPIPGLPEINHFGYFDSKEAQATGEHQHPDSFEFVYIEKGKASWEVNHFHFEAKAGDVFHTRPNEFHRASNNVIEPCRVWHFGLRAPFRSADGIDHHWMRQSPEDIQQLVDGLHNLPRVTFLGDLPLYSFRRLAKAIQQPGPLSRLEGRTAVLDLILQFLEASETKRVGTNSILYKIEKLANAFTFDQKVSIEEMAAKAGISKAYLYRLFLENTGMTPRAYFERLRVKEACRRLTETETPITSIALELGFATSQHFATIFHRLTGRTPTQWRNRNMDVDSWFATNRNGKNDFTRVREP